MLLKFVVTMVGMMTTLQMVASFAMIFVSARMDTFPTILHKEAVVQVTSAFSLCSVSKGVQMAFLTQVKNG